MKSTYKSLLVSGVFSLLFFSMALANFTPDIPLYAISPFEPNRDPIDLIHPLRQLGMVTGCTNAWMSQNHDGLKEHGVPDPKLEDAVCALIDVLPGTYKDSFMVFDYGMYPPLVYMDRGAAHDSAFLWMKEKMVDQFNPPFYLLIGKQINPEDESVEFRVALNLPRYGSFGDMNSTLEMAFQNQILEVLLSDYSKIEGITVNPSAAEKEGIDNLTSLLQELLAGTYGGGITEELLILNGFQEFPVEPTDTLNFEETSDSALLNSDLRDYARRKVYYALGDTLVHISEYAELGMADFTNQYGFSAAFIFTDNSNYSEGVSNDFENANSDFQSLSQSLITWLHYFTPDDPTQPNKLFIKYDDNMTQAEAEAALDTIFYEYQVVAGTTSALTGTGNGAFGKMMEGGICDPQPSCNIFGDDWAQWRTKCCFMGDKMELLMNWVEESNVNPFKSNPLYYSLPNEVQDSMLMFAGGLGCGFTDGLLDVALTVTHIAGFAGESIKHMPGNFVWFSHFFKKAWKKRAFMRVLKISLKEDIDFWKKRYSTAIMFVKIFKDLELEKIGLFIGDLWNELQVWIGYTLFQYGSRWAGYTYGKFLFEILLDYLTSGLGRFSSAKKSILKNMIKETNGSPHGLVNLLRDAYNSPNVKHWKKAMARAGIGGVF